MRLTRAGEYAVRCIIYLCNRKPGELVSRQEIADNCDIPAHFLAKIAQQLAKQGLIEIRQGAYGGIVLAKKPEEISLLEIVETMIGEIYLNDCIVRPESCGMNASCAVHHVWQAARKQLRATLAAVSMAELRTRTNPRPLAAGKADPTPKNEDS